MRTRLILTVVMLAGGVSFGIGLGVLVRMAVFGSAYSFFPNTPLPGAAIGVGLALLMTPIVWRDRR